MRHSARRELPCRVRDRKSDADEPLNQANAKTDERGNDEQQQKRLTGDSGTEACNPSHSGIDEAGYIGKNGSHKQPSLHTDEPLNQTNTQTDESNNDKSQNEGIGSDSTGKRTDPLDSLSDEGSNVGNDSGDSSSNFLKEHPF